LVEDTPNYLQPNGASDIYGNCNGNGNGNVLFRLVRSSGPPHTERNINMSSSYDVNVLQRTSRAGA
jgi:hypothetical protein